MKQFTQNIILNTGRRAQISKRARKLPCNGWKKRKKGRKGGKEIRTGPVPPRRELWRRKGSAPRKSPPGQRDQPGEGELRSLGGEHSSGFVIGKMEGDLHRWPGPPPCAPHPGPRPLVWAGTGCWSLGFGGQTQGEDWGWLCEIEEARVWQPRVYWEKAWAHQRGKAPCLRGGCRESSGSNMAAFSLCALRRPNSACANSCGTCELPLLSWAPEAGVGSNPQKTQEQALVAAHTVPRVHGLSLLPHDPWVGINRCSYHPRRAQGHRLGCEQVLVGASIVPGACTGHCTCTPYIKGIMASSCWVKRQQVSKLKAAPWLQTRWWSRKTWAHLCSEKNQSQTQVKPNCWTTIDNKEWNLPEKILYIPRQHKMIREGSLCYKQIPYPPGKWPTNWKI